MLLFFKQTQFVEKSKWNVLSSVMKVKKWMFAKMCFFFCFHFLQLQAVFLSYSFANSRMKKRVENLTNRLSFNSLHSIYLLHLFHLFLIWSYLNNPHFVSSKRFFVGIASVSPILRCHFLFFFELPLLLNNCTFVIFVVPFSNFALFSSLVSLSGTQKMQTNFKCFVVIANVSS